MASAANRKARDIFEKFVGLLHHVKWKIPRSVRLLFLHFSSPVFTINLLLMPFSSLPYAVLCLYASSSLVLCVSRTSVSLPCHLNEQSSSTLKVDHFVLVGVFWWKFVYNKISQKTQDSLRPSEIRLGKRWLKLLHPFEFRVHKTSAVRSLSRPSEDVARNSKICKR